MNKRTQKLFEAADPARGIPIGPGDIETLLHQAHNDITSHEAVAPPRRRTPQLVAVGAAFAAVGIAATAFAMTRSPGNQAASPGPLVAPDLSAGPTGCLTSIADQLQTTAYDGTTGRYTYIRTTGTNSDQTQLPNNHNAMATALFKFDTWLWLAADGSGREREARQAPTYPDPASRNFYTQNPGLAPKAGTTTHDLHVGEYIASPLPAADPAAMERELYQPRENGPAQAIVGVADLNRAVVPDAAHRAAALRFLAGTDGVMCLGEQTDPAGRTGIEVGADRGRGTHPTPGDQGREFLLLDPRTGEVMASGSGTAASPPAWVAVYLERGYTDVLG